MPNGPNVQRRVADQLVAEGLISAEQREAAFAFVAAHGGRVEDALVELNLVAEAELLKAISTLHSTRFVSSERLAKAHIEPGILARVPKNLALVHGLLPILFDAEHVLTVATADPADAGALEEVKLASGAKEVRPIVALPKAVQAAIARAYAPPAPEFGPPPGVSPAAASLLVNQTPAPTAVSSGVVFKPSNTLPPRPGEPPPVVLSRDYVETVSVFVSLLDNTRQDLRGHSSSVARVAQKLCDRIGFAPEQVTKMVLAAYFHDLGKAGAYHLTALNVAEFDGHRTAAKKFYEVPVTLLGAISLSSITKSAVSSMYERYDGQGFPNALAGSEIPVGARVLAVSDSYADLTQNPRNPARRILTPAEACAVLAEHKGSIFDPTIVELLTHTVTSEELRTKLLSEGRTVLIADPDPEDTTVLELRLIEQGFEVRVARTLRDAIDELKSQEIAAVISEIDLETPEAGVALRSEATRAPWGQNIVWMIHTKKTDRRLANAVFDLGVDDFIPKATGPDALVEKLKQSVGRKKRDITANRGVSGNLTEMSLADMVQILCHGRKTGALRVRTGEVEGQIFFNDGQMVDAECGHLLGEDAVYFLLTLVEGDFDLDPKSVAKRKTIETSPEVLLREGMRRLGQTGSG